MTVPFLLVSVTASGGDHLANPEILLLIMGLLCIALFHRLFMVNQKCRHIRAEREVIEGFIHDVADVFADSSDVGLDQLLERVLFYAQNTSRASAGAIYMFDRENATLKARAVSGIFPSLDFPITGEWDPSTPLMPVSLHDHVIRRGEGLVGRVAETSVPILIPDAEIDPRVPIHSAEFLRIRSLMLVPMRFRHTTLGVMVVSNPVDGRPFVQNDLTLMQGLADQASVSVHYVNLREELAEKARIDHDLRVARDIQTGMLPKELPKVPGLEVAAFTQPAQEIGGDFYDFIPIDESHIGIVVADIAGKGVSGALLMAVCRSVLRARAIRISPADTLKGLNRVIAAEISEGMFACVLYMVYNTLTRELCIARAGMERPVVYSADTGDMRLITTKGTPIGLMDRAVFESTLVETTLQLKPGDTVVAFTDGVIEAMNHENHEWGRENLYTAVREGVSQGAEGVLRLVRQRLDAHCGTRPQYDDITLLTLQSR